MTPPATLTAVALDDEPAALRISEALAGQTDGLTLAATFTSVREARAYLEAHDVDLLIVDVEMPAQSGMDFVRDLRQRGGERMPLVIFATAYAEHAVVGFALDAVDYLLKPFSPERFARAIAKARELHAARSTSDGVASQAAAPADALLMLRVDYGTVRLRHADISHVEALDNYLRIHRHAPAKSVTARLTMKALTELLPAPAFLRTHRSHLVATAAVERLRSRTLQLRGGAEVPVSERYLPAIRTALEEA